MVFRADSSSRRGFRRSWPVRSRGPVRTAWAIRPPATTNCFRFRAAGHITYAADLETFHRRANHLLSLRADYLAANWEVGRMLEQILRFLNALDAAMIPHAAEGGRLDLYHIGRSAFVLHYGLPLAAGGTKDFDTIQISHPPTQLAEKAVDLFGKGMTAARNLGLYLELVLDAVPPVPAGFRNRCEEVKGEWQVIRLWRLEVHDLAATKLKSFRGQDRTDLQFLCDTKRLDAAKLTDSLESAFCWSMEKDGDPDRERAFADLGALSSTSRARRAPSNPPPPQSCSTRPA